MRPDRPQDHRRHLRRRGPAWRRRLSGKDPTKVDRSAAYAARYLAKNVVAAGLADRCTIQLSYAIGVAEPLSVYIDTHGTGKVDEAKLEVILPQMMNLKPRGIREHLDLNKPIYRPYRRLWPFRPRARWRRRLLVGEDRPGRRDQVRGLIRPELQSPPPPQAAGGESAPGPAQRRACVEDSGALRETTSARNGSGTTLWPPQRPKAVPEAELRRHSLPNSFHPAKRPSNFRTVFRNYGWK